jgi:hypothetical protein
MVKLYVVVSRKVFRTNAMTLRKFDCLANFVYSFDSVGCDKEAHRSCKIWVKVKAVTIVRVWVKLLQVHCIFRRYLEVCYMLKIAELF